MDSETNRVRTRLVVRSGMVTKASWGEGRVRKDDLLVEMDPEFFEVPEGLELGDTVLRGNKTVVGVRLAEGATFLGEEAMRRCEKLREARLPDSVREIGHGAFRECTALTGIALPAKLEVLGEDSFRGCGNLKEITVPSGVRVLEAGTFQACTALERVGLPSGMRTLEEDVFQGCSSLREIKLPSTLTSIGDRAFRDSGLVRLRVPGKVREIGEEAFFGCKALADVVLPKSLRTIGKNAFADTRLASITIPAETTEVCDWNEAGASPTRVNIAGRNVLNYADAFGKGEVQELCLPDVRVTELPSAIRPAAARGFAVLMWEKKPLEADIREDGLNYLRQNRLKLWTHVPSLTILTDFDFLSLAEAQVLTGAASLQKRREATAILLGYSGRFPEEERSLARRAELDFTEDDLQEVP